MSVDVVALVARLQQTYEQEPCGQTPPQQMHAAMPEALQHLWRLAWLQQLHGEKGDGRVRSEAPREATAALARHNVCNPGPELLELEVAVAREAPIPTQHADAMCAAVCRSMRHGQVIYGTGLAWVAHAWLTAPARPGPNMPSPKMFEHDSFKRQLQVPEIRRAAMQVMCRLRQNPGDALWVTCVDGRKARSPFETLGVCRPCTMVAKLHSLVLTGSYSEVRKDELATDSLAVSAVATRLRGLCRYDLMQRALRFPDQLVHMTPWELERDARVQPIVVCRMRRYDTYFCPQTDSGIGRGEMTYRTHGTMRQALSFWRRVLSEHYHDCVDGRMFFHELNL